MPNVLTMPEKRAGAMPDEWNTLVWGLELTEDLLPVVSNLAAEISPQSNMKALGKTPSLYNATRRVVGFTQWTQHSATLDDINTWQKERDYGICIQTRRVRAIDVDVTDAESAAAIQSFIAARYDLPARTRANSSKFLLAFNLTGTYPKRVIRTAHGIIEFLGNGQQFIACGTHPSGVRYEWAPHLPDSLPSLSKSEFNTLWSALETEFAVEASVTSKTTSRHEVLNNAIVSDPVAQHLIANHAALGIAPDKKIFIECPWKDNHSIDSGETETVYYPAHTNGHANGAFKCLHAGCEKKTQQDFLDAFGYTARNPFDDLVEEPAEEVTPLRYQFVRGDVYANRPPPKWHIKKVLPESPLVIIFGASGSGKSFFAIDLGMAIARGVEWRGQRVAQTSVAYVVAEGINAFASRLKAYAQQHDIDLGATPFHSLGDTPNMTDKRDVVDLARGIRACGARVVFVDTWAQVTPGANENSGEEIGAALALCRELHKHTGATVVLIDHSGKDSSKGARGWSGKHAAADAVIEIIRADTYRSASVVKMKDGEDGAEYPFSLETITIGLDDDDEKIESCVVIHNHTARPEKVKVERAKVGKHQSLALRLIGEIDFDPELGVPPSALIAAMLANSVGHEDPKKDRRAEVFNRSINELIERGELEMCNGNLKVRGA